MDYDVTDYDLMPNLEDILPFEDGEQRTPCVLLLDTSSSMCGAPISELNDGLQVFKRELMDDVIARRRVEVSIITFGGKVDLVQDFVTAEEFQPPHLSASGRTPIGEAIDRALDRVAMQVSLYERAGVPQTKPWVFLMSDGAPTDDWQRAAERVQRRATELAFFSVGIGHANMNTLARIAPAERPPLRLDGLKFSELFEWLRRSLKSCSQAPAGQQAALPSPEKWAKGWGQA